MMKQKNFLRKSVPSVISVGYSPTPLSFLFELKRRFKRVFAMTANGTFDRVFLNTDFYSLYSAGGSSFIRLPS